MHHFELSINIRDDVVETSIFSSWFVFRAFFSVMKTENRTQ